MSNPRRVEGFTLNELRMLWVIKRHGGKLTTEHAGGSIYSFLADELCISQATVRASLRQLERESVVIRHFKRPVTAFAGGPNTLMAVELVDPSMKLPPVEPVPLAVVVAHENAELLERTAHEPDAAQMLNALVDRCVELQQQIDKLVALVEKLNEENTSLKKRVERKPPPEHLTSRIKNVLTDEQWERMRHESGDK